MEQNTSKIQCTDSDAEVSRKEKTQTSLKIQRIGVNFYLFLAALYFFLAATYLTNVLINLTIGDNIGLYFEFINASIDRIIVYTLSFITMCYIPAKFSRKLLPSLLLITSVVGGYFAFLQIVDALIILASFIISIWLLTNHEPFPGMSGRKTVSTVFIYLVLILIVIEVLSLLCWFIFPFFFKPSEGGSCRFIVDLETKIFLFTGSLAPLFTVLFLFSWVTKLLSTRAPLKKFFIFLTQPGRLSNDVCLTKPYFSLLLICSVVFSFLVALYPYLPGLNMNMRPIGVDIPLYEDWLLKLENKDVFGVFTRAFFEHPDRPLSLLVMYFVKYVSGFSALSVAQFCPLILAPAVVLAVYFFMREANHSGWVPSLAAFLSLSSFHITVGMYAGFLSNWMAIIESYLFMGFFFGSLRKRSRLRLVVALLTSISLLFTHAGTWGMTMGILLVYLFLTLLMRKTGNYSLEIRLLVLILLVNVLVGGLRNYALGWPVGEIETLKVAQNTVSVNSSGSFWNDALYTFFHTMYGFFVNPLALLLAFLGGCIIVLDDKPVNRYLTSWLIASSIFFVLTLGWGIKSRILFNVPLPIFETFGLIYVNNTIQKFFGARRGSIVKVLATLFILLVSLNYAFRCAFAMSQVTYDLFP